MSAKASLAPRTWLEIDAAAARHNYRTFRRLIGPKVQLWSVVKSNAYGHGLTAFAGIMDKLGVDGFCVDSLIEGVRLRENGIRKRMLVIGSTLPELFKTAAGQDIAISIATFDDVKALAALDAPPRFHVEIDTGFHRRGFYPDDIPKLIKIFHAAGLAPEGVYTHFASDKDIAYRTYTELQFGRFQKAKEMFKRSGFARLISHASASGGALISRNQHEDAVRIGMGLYGYAPSPSIEVVLRPDLHPVLAWRAIVSEVKPVSKDSYVGYDMTERLTRNTRLAVIPVGYWHGIYRSLSGSGAEILIKGRRARIAGRVSMDIIVADVTGTSVKPGDLATLIGRDGREGLTAVEMALHAGTSHYEFLTRINPLIERRVL